MKSAARTLFSLSVFALGAEGVSTQAYLPKRQGKPAATKHQILEPPAPETGTDAFPLLPDVSQMLGNADIRARSKQLEDSNKLMRDELQALGGKLHAAEGFVTDTLKSGDASRAKELAATSGRQAAVAVTASSVNSAIQAAAGSVASSATAASDSDSDGDDADDQGGDSDDGPMSLLVVDEARVQTPVAEAPQTDGDARQLIKVLQSSAVELAEQELAGEAQLKALFQKSFKVGAHRHQALLVQQKTLNATRASLSELQGRLSGEEAHLMTSKSDLEQRLHGLGLYLQQLEHLALAPEAEAPRLLAGLPSSVAAAAPAAGGEGRPLARHA